VNSEKSGIESFRWLAGVIAAHPDRRVVGSIRLQNTVNLLQRTGLPCDYYYMNSFQGPYSEGLNADIVLLTTLGLIDQQETLNGSGKMYMFEAEEKATLSALAKYAPYIKVLSEAQANVLDCAATFESYRELGLSFEEAENYVCRKKPSTCDPQTTTQAFGLLKSLGLL